MLTSLSFIFLVGLSVAAIVERLRLPRIVGMLVSGVVLGPYVLDLLDPSILGISSELRSMALIIILIKAGLSLDLSDLKKVGRPAVMMSFVPACCEIVGYVIFAPLLLGVSRIDAALMGAVLGAVSPAVVVPRMLRLMDEKYGTGKCIPQLITAGASCDDIFVIVLFTAFADMSGGGKVNYIDFVNIPVSVLLGIALGALAGFVLSFVFVTSHAHGREISGSVKVTVVLGTVFLLMAAETWAEGYVAISGLLAVVGMACTVKRRCPAAESADLSVKFGGLWSAAEVLLFVLVGAAVDIRYTLDAGIAAVGMIFIALIFRAAGVLLCLAGTPLDLRERLFCVIAYLPKATVQAAIGSVPRSMGLPCGNIILSVAVLAIIITAPLGAVGIDASCKKLLKRE